MPGLYMYPNGVTRYSYSKMDRPVSLYKYVVFTSTSSTKTTHARLPRNEHHDAFTACLMTDSFVLKDGTDKWLTKFCEDVRALWMTGLVTAKVFAQPE